MAQKKQNLNSYVRTGQQIYDLDAFWSDNFSEVFRPDIKNLHSIHKVPKYSKKYISNW